MTHIIHKPKHIAAISITVAIIIGIIGAIIITRPPAYQFAKAGPGIINNVWSLGTTTSTTAQNLTLSFQSGGQIESVSVKVGDTVKAGVVLAMLDPENTAGALIQAKAAYASALANYTKLMNGATSADIAVSSSSLISAQTALAHSEQTLVQTLNDSLTAGMNAVRNNTDMFFNNPETDTPTLNTSEANFSNQSLQYQIQSERASINTMLPSWQQELSGVSTASDLSALANRAQNNLQTISTYLGDLNSLFTTYASGNVMTADSVQASILSAQGAITGQIAALTGATQAVSGAQAGVAQSQAGLTLKTSQARPEDIAAAQAQVTSAEGAVEIAQSAYNNRIITAPGDGVVTAVYVTVGQIAAANTPAIDLAGQTISKNVSVIIPNSAIIDNAGTLYVLVKSGNGTVQKIITVGASDATNTEILSGLSAGDEVVTH